MNQDIHSHLEKLKRELEKLEPAVKHLQKADENATELVASLSNIHNAFTKHLKDIDKSLSDANEKHHTRLTKEIQYSTKKISDVTEQLSKSNSVFENQIITFLAGYEGLATTAKKLVEKIDRVDFPTRFEKLDATVSSINQGFQNTQTRIGASERNLKDYTQAKSKEIRSKLDEIVSSINQGFQNTNTRIGSSEINLKDHFQAKLEEITSKMETTESSLKERIESSGKNMAKALSKGNKLLKVLLFASIGLNMIIIILQFFQT